MATSGTYSYNPPLGRTVLNAFARIGIHRTMLVQEHMEDAAIEANNVLVELSNLQPNLWTIKDYSVTLTQGTATYTLPADLVDVLNAFVRTTSGSMPTDRIVYPFSHSEYAAVPNKEQQGFPTTFWFNRQITPEITMWQVPDGNGPYVLHLYYVRQVQDAVVSGGLTMDIPYRFYDAFTANLSARLARIYAPDRLKEAEAERDRTWAIASVEDTENVPLVLAIGSSGYFR